MKSNIPSAKIPNPPISEGTFCQERRGNYGIFATKAAFLSICLDFQPKYVYNSIWSFGGDQKHKKGVEGKQFLRLPYSIS
jgi:hypothetical protein